MLTLLAEGTSCVPQHVIDAAKDRDGDGYYAAEVGGPDCDDANALVNPGAPEVCGDGLDNDCDGAVDTDGFGSWTWYPDADGDGYGVDAPVQSCTAPEEHVADLDDGEDCDDTSALVCPGCPELCDGTDNDCDGEDDRPGTASVEFVSGAWQDVTGPLIPVRGRLELAGAFTLWLCDGVWDDQIVVGAGANATIAGRYGRDATVLDGSNSLTPIQAAGAVRIVVNDLTVTKGAGAIEVVGPAAELHISDSQILESQAADGAGVYFRGAVLTITDTLVQANVAETDGGGIDADDYQGGGLAMTITDSVVSDNYAGGSGGGIRLHDGSADIVDSTLSNNHAEAYGGGLRSNYGDITLLGSSWDNNSSGIGGAVFVDNRTDGLPIVLDNCQFTANVAGAGGAIMVYQGPLDVIDSWFVGNQSSADGGAIGTSGDEMYIETSVFTSNGAGGDGGAIDHLGEIEIVESEFAYNTAAQAGGALRLRYGVLSLSNTSVYSNSAMTGGAVHLSGSTYDASCHATTSGAGIYDNTATDDSLAHSGGGVFIDAVTALVESDGCTWGTGATDNDPSDVSGPTFSESAYADDETFCCTQTGCTPGLCN